MSLAGWLRGLAFPQPVGGVALVRSHAVPSNRAASFLLIVRDLRDLASVSQFAGGVAPCGTDHDRGALPSGLAFPGQGSRRPARPPVFPTARAGGRCPFWNSTSFFGIAMRVGCPLSRRALACATLPLRSGGRGRLLPRKAACTAPRDKGVDCRQGHVPDVGRVRRHLEDRRRTRHWHQRRAARCRCLLAHQLSSGGATIEPPDENRFAHCHPMTVSAVRGRLAAA